MKSVSLARFSLVAFSSFAFACGSAGGTAAPDGKGADSPATQSGDQPLVGQPAPDFSFTSVNGQGSVALSKMQGKVIVVDFWATWCEPCKKSFPKLQEMNVKYKASGLEVVGISEDDDKKGIPDFGTTYGAKFPLGWDETKSIAGKWQPKSMPGSFIVDKKGIVRFAHLGFHDGDEVKLESEIKSLL